MVGGAGSISLLSSVTKGGRRIEPGGRFLRDTIRDPSTPTHDFMELFEGAIVDHVTTRCQNQGQLLEEAQRELEMFKKAYYNAEREIQDLGERFEWETRPSVPIHTSSTLAEFSLHETRRAVISHGRPPRTEWKQQALTFACPPSLSPRLGLP